MTFPEDLKNYGDYRTGDLNAKSLSVNIALLRASRKLSMEKILPLPLGKPANVKIWQN